MPLSRVSLRGAERSGATKQSHHSEREFVLWGCFVVVPPPRNDGWNLYFGVATQKFRLSSELLLARTLIGGSRLLRRRASSSQ